MKTKIGTTESYSNNSTYHTPELWQKATYIKCACHSPEHTLEIIQSMDHDDDPAYMYLSFHIQLRTGTLWQRIKNAWFYLLGRKSRYGDYDEMIVDDVDAIRKIASIADETANVVEKARAEWKGDRLHLIEWWFNNRKHYWLEGPDAWDHDELTDVFPKLYKEEGTCNIIGMSHLEPGWYIETSVIERDIHSVHDDKAHNWYGPFSSAMAAISFMRYRKEHLETGITNTDGALPFNVFTTHDNLTYCELFVRDDTEVFDIKEAEAELLSTFNEHDLRIINV